MYVGTSSCKTLENAHCTFTIPIYLERRRNSEKCASRGTHCQCKLKIDILHWQYSYIIYLKEVGISQIPMHLLGTYMYCK